MKMLTTAIAVLLIAASVYGQGTRQFTDFQLPFAKSAYIPDSTDGYFTSHLQTAGIRDGSITMAAGFFYMDDALFELGYAVTGTDYSQSYTGFSFGTQVGIAEFYETQLALAANARLQSYELGRDKSGMTTGSRSRNLDRYSIVGTGSRNVAGSLYAHASVGFLYQSRDIYDGTLPEGEREVTETDAIIPVSIALSYKLQERLALHVQYQGYFPSVEYSSSFIACTASWEVLAFYLEAGYMRYLGTEYEHPEGAVIGAGLLF